MKTVKRINLNELIWFLLLSGFSVLLLYLISSKQIYSFIHPRLHKYIFFSFIVVFILTVNQLKNITKMPNHSIRIKKGYLLFCLPLIFMSLGSNSTTLDIASENGVIISSDQEIQSKHSPQSSSLEYKEEIAESQATPMENTSLDFVEESDERSTEIEQPSPITSTSVDDVLILTSDNFIYACEDIHMYLDDYIGRRIEFKGMVLKRDDFEIHHFVVGRLLMYCCVADAQLIGIMCQSEQVDSFENDEYVELTGTIDRYLFENHEQESEIWIPIIKIDEIHKTEPLSNPYVYF